MSDHESDNIISDNESDINENPNLEAEINSTSDVLETVFEVSNQDKDKGYENKMEILSVEKEKDNESSDDNTYSIPMEFTETSVSENSGAEVTLENSEAGGLAKVLYVKNIQVKDMIILDNNYYRNKKVNPEREGEK